MGKKCYYCGGTKFVQSEVGVAVCAACFAEEVPNEVAVEPHTMEDLKLRDSYREAAQCIQHTALAAPRAPREERDDPETLLQVQYQNACHLQEKGEFAEAMPRFLKLVGYRDAEERLAVCRREVVARRRAAAEGESEAHEAKEKKAKLFLMIAAGVLALILFLSIVLPALNAGAHDVKKIKVEITDMRVEYDPNARPYINGCYYIHLDFEIKNGTRTPIKYVKVLTHVFDKDSRELGTITSPLLNYEEQLGGKKSTTQTTTVAENQPNSNSFFKTMYDTPLEDLRFSYEILAVSFGDGKIYDAER